MQNLLFLEQKGLQKIVRSSEETSDAFCEIAGEEVACETSGKTHQDFGPCVFIKPEHHLHARYQMPYN